MELLGALGDIQKLDSLILIVELWFLISHFWLLIASYRCFVSRFRIKETFLLHLLILPTPVLGLMH